MLVAWRMYARIRRMIGRQHLSPRRPWVTVIVFPLLLFTLGPGAFHQAATTFALLAGIGAGIALGFYGLQLTKFERTSAGLYYTPNAHVGIALSMLFTGRVLYRLVQTLLDGPVPAPAGQIASSPLTLVIFGTLAGYYVTYAIGLLRWGRRVARDLPAAADATAE